MAAGIEVASAEAVRGPLESVSPAFTRQTGCGVAFAFMTAGQVRARVEAGEALDVAIASRQVIDGLVETGKAAHRTDLGRIGLAVAVREGAAVPGLATADAFVAALRGARSISFTSPAAGGTAGLYVAGLLQRLGISDEVGRKAVYATGGRDAAHKVARGEAEFAVTFPSEIVPVKGARVGGMLPPELQSYTTYAAAIPAASGDRASAVAFVAALTAAPACAHWTAAGFEPPD